MTGKRLVAVSGPPAAGKTVLAGPLAAELGFALIAKDRIKETLADALGAKAGRADLAWSQRLGAAAMELLWALAADAPAAVLEANFWPADPRPAARLRALGGVLVEVHCRCPLDECARRYRERANSRHPIHLDALDARTERASFERCSVPLGLGPVIVADTTQWVDIPALAGEVRQAFAAAVAVAATDAVAVAATDAVAVAATPGPAGVSAS